MYKNFALIKDGKIKNIIVADEAFIALIQNEWDYCIEIVGELDVPSIGWSYDGQNFSKPLD